MNHREYGNELPLYHSTEGSMLRMSHS